nr:hypothetical protein [Chlamydiota bacterium]
MQVVSSPDYTHKFQDAPPLNLRDLENLSPVKKYQRIIEHLASHHFQKTTKSSHPHEIQPPYPLDQDGKLPILTAISGSLGSLGISRYF